MLVCHPFDVLRVRMQTDGRVGVTVTKLLAEMLKKEGASSLYRGFMPPFFAQGLYKSTIFCANSLVNQHLFSGDKNRVAVFASGCIAGSVNSFIVSPVELVRTRQIVSSASLAVTQSMRACLGALLAEPRGVIGLWRGLLPTVVRDGPGVGFYLLAFEESKRLLGPSSTTGSQPQAGSLPLATRIAAAACAGIAFWAWALPVDGLKTLVEVETTGLTAGTSRLASTRAVMDSLSRRGGMSRLFKAWPVAFGRGLPSAVITLTVYDFAIEVLEAG